jgi:hypothetical protein
MIESNDRVAEWMAVLERIEQSLARSLSQTPEVPPPPVNPPLGESGPLEKLDTRLAQWQACLEQVEQQAARAESELDSDRAAVDQWLRDAAEVQEKLAESVRREGGGRLDVSPCGP